MGNPGGGGLRHRRYSGPAGPPDGLGGQLEYIRRTVAQMTGEKLDELEAKLTALESHPGPARTMCIFCTCVHVYMCVFMCKSICIILCTLSV